jgi:hypothetical protein
MAKRSRASTEGPEKYLWVKKVIKEVLGFYGWPTDIMISVQPDGDSWKVAVMQAGSGDADRREMVEQIAARLKGEYDFKG